MDVFLLIYILIILIMHELGHVLSAKAMNFNIDKIGFSWKPVPRFFVSIIDVNIPMNKRLIYLLSGSFMTLMLFIVFLYSGIGSKSLYYAFSYQLIVETNPFFSDFVVAIISYVYRDNFKKIFMKKYSKYSTEQSPNSDDFKDIYIFSSIWYVHFVIWAILIIFLLSPKLLMSINFKM